MFVKARRGTARCFVFFIIAYLIMNIIMQRGVIISSVKNITPPSSPGDVRATISELENIIDNNNFSRFAFINLYAYLNVLMNKEELGNFDLLRGRDGFLNYGSFYQTIPDELEEYALRVRRLKDYAARSDCEVLFVGTLPLYIKGHSTYSVGLPYKDTNPLEDAMLYHLQSYGVDYMDVRTALAQSDLPPERYRYKADHHWTIEASFEAFRALIGKLNNEYGEELDPEGFYRDINNYSKIEYKNAFEGSLYIRAGAPFAEKDDFNYILPEFDTSFYIERYAGDKGRQERGKFAEVLIDENYINAVNMYVSYAGGLESYKHIVNENNPNGLKMLFIHDSFSLPLAAFMASTVGELDMIYPLAEDMFGSEIDIDEYIEENVDKYDYIIVEIAPDNYNNAGFSFFMP